MLSWARAIPSKLLQRQLSPRRKTWCSELRARAPAVRVNVHSKVDCVQADSWLLGAYRCTQLTAPHAPYRFRCRSSSESRPLRLRSRVPFSSSAARLASTHPRAATPPASMHPSSTRRPQDPHSTLLSRMALLFAVGVTVVCVRCIQSHLWTHNLRLSPACFVSLSPKAKVVCV